MGIDIGSEIETWTRLAAVHGKESWEGTPEAANRAFKQRKALETRLEESDAAAVPTVLKSLLSHADPYVRGAAAAWMLRFDPEAAIPVLEDLQRVPGSGSWRITAEYVLKAYRDGELG